MFLADVTKVPVAKLEQFSTTEVQKLQAQLKEVDASRIDGQFRGPDGEPLKGSEKVSDLLTRVLKWSDIVLERYISPLFPPAAY